MNATTPVLSCINPALTFPNNLPLRIVSLVPSQTELLHYLGLTDEVVGITKFCVHPKDWHQSKKRVGGTKQYKLDIIEKLQPTLILGNKEENDKEQILELAEKYPVWISDIKTLDDAYQMILGVGALVQKVEKANELVQKLKQQFGQLPKNEIKVRAAYFIWSRPLMVAGGGTFINDMMKVAGFQNVFDDKPRYPHVTIERVHSLQPEAILLSSEPYPFKKGDLEEFREACPWATIILVDGELFSWYGNRLLNSASYFKKLIKAFEPE